MEQEERTARFDEVLSIEAYRFKYKYTLLRSFTRQKGLTPYQYLETIRINHAKKLLEQGITLIESAGQSGFTDQSHFTKFFKNFIGLTPKQYQNIFTDNDK